MFYPLQNTSVFNVFYMGTDPNYQKPGDMIIELRKDGLRLKRGFRKLGTIDVDRMVSTRMDYNVGTAGLSASGALAGGILAGEIGALAGAAAGKNKKTVDSFVTLIYKDKGNKEQKLTFNSTRAEKIKKKLDKRYQLGA